MNKMEYNKGIDNVIDMCKHRKQRYPEVPFLLFYAIIIATLPLVIIADMLGDAIILLLKFPLWLKKVFDKK